MHKDIDLKFNRHPVTGDVSARSGNRALLQSVRNICMTAFGDWQADRRMGSASTAQLGENNSPLFLVQLKDDLTRAIEEHEPRVEVAEVLAKSDATNYNAIRVRVDFYPLNEDEVVTLDEVLERTK